MSQKEQKLLPELLYFGKGDFPYEKIHLHAFYQMEYCLSGQLGCSTPDENFILHPGELWLIPPETPHCFTGHHRDYSYLSLKFHTRLPVAGYHGRDMITDHLLTAIQKIIDQQEEVFSPYSPEGKFIIESHLHGVLCRLTVLAEKNSRESPLLGTIREQVYQKGYRINVAALAEKMHLTRSQFYYLFCKENKREYTVKQFIDSILLDVAKNHLRYSSMNLTEIAKVMNFPSLYAFSRFYKNQTGLSPLESRQALAIENTKQNGN